MAFHFEMSRKELDAHLEAIKEKSKKVRSGCTVFGGLETLKRSIELDAMINSLIGNLSVSEVVENEDNK